MQQEKKIYVTFLLGFYHSLLFIDDGPNHDLRILDKGYGLVIDFVRTLHEMLTLAWGGKRDRGFYMSKNVF